MKKIIKYAGLTLISLFFLIGGQAHFTSTQFFVSIVPPYIPLPLATRKSDQLSGRLHNHSATTAITRGVPMRNQSGNPSSCRSTALPNMVRVAQTLPARGTTRRSRQLRMCGP
jgi:hypothetical protein